MSNLTSVLCHFCQSLTPPALLLVHSKKRSNRKTLARIAVMKSTINFMRVLYYFSRYPPVNKQWNFVTKETTRETFSVSLLWIEQFSSRLIFVVEYKFSPKKKGATPSQFNAKRAKVKEARERKRSLCINLVTYLEINKYFKVVWNDGKKTYLRSYTHDAKRLFRMCMLNYCKLKLSFRFFSCFFFVVIF